MDLSALGSSLPPGLAQTEREMSDKFRASALSITTLYKSALAATKQAYSVGYTSCLTDVLEIVQNSLSESPEHGQDAGQALSRLMDWADARKAAMQAFESDEEREDSSTSNQPARASTSRVQKDNQAPAQSVEIGRKAGSSIGPRSSLPSHIAHSAPVRPSSAPLTPTEHERRFPRGRSADPSYSLPPIAGPSHSQPEPDSIQTPAPIHSRNTQYQPSPAHYLSSSPTSSHVAAPFVTTSSHASPTSTAQHSRQTKHFPRHSMGGLPSVDVHGPPSTGSFAPSLALDDVPFIAFPNAHHTPTQVSVMESDFTIGSKRPLSAVIPSADEMTGVEETMPPLARSGSTGGARGGRGRKPGRSAGHEDGCGGNDERDRKRASRRGGPGPGV